MAKLVKCNMEYFKKKISTVQIIAFGAGRKFRQFVSEFHLEKKIEFIVDNDINIQGTEIEINGIPIQVENIQKLLNHPISEYIILITNAYSIAQIMEQLNEYKELEGIECFSASLMQDNCSIETITYSTGVALIPKIIHYCWFGGNPITEKMHYCMNSWKKYCPDYEIIRWDESNYNVKKNQYMFEAYKVGKWGFVPDYARLDIVGTYGGIYLDTDVEIVKSFDDLIFDMSFWGFANYSVMLAGLGFGAVAGNELVLQMRDYYNGKRFIKEDGSMDLRPCCDYQDEVLKSYGFIMNNKQQKINGNVLYPMEVFNPTGVVGICDLYTENTHSIHWTTGSWESKKNIRDLNEGRNKLRSILQ